MFSSMMRRIARRDLVFLFIGAFSALAVLTLTNKGLHSTILSNDRHVAVVSPPKKDWGLYEDWSSGEEAANVAPADEEKKDIETVSHPPNTEPLSVIPEPEPVSPPEPSRQAIGSSFAKNGRPSTRVLNHAPGWTMFENLYMSNGTLFIVSAPDDPPNPLGVKQGWENGFPLRRFMTSTGLPGYATEESVREREPTDKEMAFISREEAERRWGDQVWEVEGNTWMFNDPNQFLGHFYHFVAESLFGFWTFYAGTLDPNPTALGETTVAAPSRAIFLRCTTSDIRDSSKFNAFYMKSAFPSMVVETAPDWNDRVFMTRFGKKAWKFSNVVLADRSASFRSDLVGSQVQRIAAAAYQAVQDKTSRWWWEPIRRAVLRAANVPDDVINMPITSVASFDSQLATENGMQQKEWPIVITYINRQGSQRSLTDEDHTKLVAELDALAKRRRWEFHDIRAQDFPQEEQLAIAAKTTIMVGVHGNGLSHLISMAPTRLSTVVEIFNPPGFVHDYGWTARALGYGHYAVWNDTVRQYPDLPSPGTPENFQSREILVYAPLVAQIIEQRVDSIMGSLGTI